MLDPGIKRWIRHVPCPRVDKHYSKWPRYKVQSVLKAIYRRGTQPPLESWGWRMETSSQNWQTPPGSPRANQYTLPPSVPSHWRTSQLRELTSSLSPWLLERAADSCAQMTFSSFSQPGRDASITNLLLPGFGAWLVYPHRPGRGGSGPLLGTGLPAVKSRIIEDSQHPRARESFLAGERKIKVSQGGRKEVAPLFTRV